LFKDTEAQKHEFSNDREKLIAYRKAIEADLNGGFASVCTSSQKQKGKSDSDS
jgi:hypothetical protein